MLPVLFSVFGFDVQSYGVSKALAALVAAFLLARAFERLALSRDAAYSLVMWATIWGFVGAKIYYLLEQLPNFDLHHLGGMGFTWYGGLIGGVIAALFIVHRHQLPLGIVAGAAAVPLTIAYGIGRLGCLLSGDGTYGRPTSVPWAMTFPHGVVPTNVPKGRETGMFPNWPMGTTSGDAMIRQPLRTERSTRLAQLKRWTGFSGRLSRSQP